MGNANQSDNQIKVKRARQNDAEQREHIIWAEKIGLLARWLPGLPGVFETPPRRKNRQRIGSGSREQAI